MEKLKAKIEQDKTITFDKILDIKEKIIYLFLLCEQAGIVLEEVDVSREYMKSNKQWFSDFKDQIKLNHLGTSLVKRDLESNQIVLKIKI